MATAPETMLSTRQAAGARYAAALTELRAAMVDLLAIDNALRNRHVGAPHIEIRSFSGEQNDIPTGMRHPDFAPDTMGGIGSEAKVREDEYLREFRSRRAVA